MCVCARTRACVRVCMCVRVCTALHTAVSGAMRMSVARTRMSAHPCDILVSNASISLLALARPARGLLALSFHFMYNYGKALELAGKCLAHDAHSSLSRVSNAVFMIMFIAVYVRLTKTLLAWRKSTLCRLTGVDKCMSKDCEIRSAWILDLVQ